MALTIEQKRAATKHLHPTAGFVIDEASGRFLKWSDRADPPGDTELEAAHAKLESRRSTSEARVNDAVSILINNGDVIRQAAKGIGEARQALDSVMPIEAGSPQDVADTLARRQGAVLFVAANALRAVAALADRGDLPDDIIEAFLHQS